MKSETDNPFSAHHLLMASYSSRVTRKEIVLVFIVSPYVYLCDDTRQFDAPLPSAQSTLATLRLQDGSVSDLLTWRAGRLHVLAVSVRQLLLI